MRPDCRRPIYVNAPWSGPGSDAGGGYCLRRRRHLGVCCIDPEVAAQMDAYQEAAGG